MGLWTLSIPEEIVRLLIMAGSWADIENFYHWEGNKLVPYMHNEQHLDSNVAPKIMSALLQLSGTKNSKVFSAQDICELDNVTEMDTKAAIVIKRINRSK